MLKTYLCKRTYSSRFSWYTTWHLLLYFQDMLPGRKKNNPENTFSPFNYVQVCNQTRDSCKGGAIERFFFNERRTKICWEDPSELQKSFLNLCKYLPASNYTYWFKLESAIRKKDKKEISALIDEGNLLLFAKKITN